MSRDEQAWECFSDPAYFDMWCVRKMGERDFRSCFHVMSREEAEGLLETLRSASGGGMARGTVKDADVDALRYLLNWGDSKSRIRTIMRTVADDGETTQDRLERLWNALVRPTPDHPVENAKSSGEVRAALGELDDYLAQLGGCSDGGCIIVKPKGMHTNGGCRCSSSRLTMQRFAYAHNRFATIVRTALETIGKERG